MCCRTEYFANSFFPYTIKKWKNLNLELRKSVSYEVFKNPLLKLIRPSPNSLFNISDSLGIKLLTRFRLGLSHVRKHKFIHNFQDTINPLCSCSLELELTTYFFLRCQNFTDLRICLMNKKMIHVFLHLMKNQNLSRNRFYMEMIDMIAKQTKV